MTVLELDRLAVDLRVDGRLRRVIHDVTLSITHGEAVGLVGESGAGKSMTSRAVIRLLPEGSVTHGDIRFEGRSVPAMGRNELRAYRSHDVAMIFQDPRAHINPVRRIGDFLTEALTERGEDRRQAVDTVTALLEQVGIHDVRRRLRQYPHELSGGLLQRVMIAAAMAIEPTLLLADEPSSGLDERETGELATMLRVLQEVRGMAVLLVEHDLGMVRAVVDRLLVMDLGRVVASGTFDEVMAAPPVRQAYLGTA